MAERSTAKAPATWGVAIEVPLKTEKPVPVTEELIEPPGAKSVRNDALFEKEDTVSCLVVEPTLTDVEIQAGPEIALV